jgi:hypothetical protein
MPNINKHLIGLRYTYSQYESTNFSLNPDLNGIKNHEQVHTLELFGRFNLPKRFQLSVFVPLNVINEYSTIKNSQSIGLGDMTIMAQYAVLNPQLCDGKPHKHQLRLGLGVKAPTGKYEKNKNNMYNTSVQLGSGSVDFLANAMYTYRYKKWILNTRLGYKLNTANSETFKFGDKIDAGVSGAYLYSKGKVTLMPSLGLVYSHSFDNYDHSQPVYYSNTDLISITVALELYVGPIAMNIAVSPVVYHRVNTMAYKQQFSAEAGIYYTFSKHSNKTKSKK